MLKKIAFAAIIMLLAWSAGATGSQAQNPKNVYNKYASAKGVTANVVTPAKLNMMSTVPYLDGVKVSDIKDHFKIMYILENVALSSEIEADVQSLLDSGGYEQVFQTRQENILVKIYVALSEDEVSEVLIVLSGQQTLTWLSISGSISQEKLAELLSKLSL